MDDENEVVNPEDEDVEPEETGESTTDEPGEPIEGDGAPIVSTDDGSFTDPGTVTDTAVRDPDGYTQATNESEAGEEPESLTITEEAPISEPVYVTKTVSEDRIISDYSAATLLEYEQAGAKAIAIFNDGTELEVQWSEVFDPRPPTQVISFDVGAIASAANQHFWTDTNGAHVTDDEQDYWIDEYALENHGTLNTPTTAKPWHNILMNSLGILLRNGLKNLSSFSKTGIAFFDGLGNEASNIVATFGSLGAQIGKSSSEHVVIDSNGLSAYDAQGNLIPANALIDGSNIINSTITNAKIVDGTITGTKMTNGTITATQIADSTITNGKIVDGTITGAKMSNGTITSTQIADSTITNAKIADGTITGAKIQGSTLTDIPFAEIDIVKAGTISSANIVADHAIVSNLSSNYAHITNGVIDNADINQADVIGLSANYAHITNGVIDNASIGHADVDGLSANYAQVGLANVNNAWIQNGTIKDGAITNGMINSVSANKLTAGTIDASNITVTNLNADNITTGTINGQRIGTGSLSLDKLADDVYTETEIDNIVDGLNDRIDGAIETFTGTDIPTLNNTPASTWTTNADKDVHIGDVYYIVNSQSQQNGFCYRFTKTGVENSVENPITYSWQLIKDSDVTAALQRLTTAEGKIGTIEQFDSSISSWKTNTDAEITSIKSAATSLTTRVSNAESDILTKVDTSTFNSLSQTVSGNTSDISTLSSTVATKADSSTVSTLSSTVNSVSQTATSNASKISQLTSTLGTNADGTTAADDVMHRTSDLEQDLSGFKTTVSSTYATKTSVTNAETRITQTELDILLKANAADVYSKTAADALLQVKANKDTLTSEINASADTVKIAANRVNIDGAAIFTSGRLSPANLNSVYGKTWYAESNTAANTADKVATISPATNDFALSTGMVICVAFSNTNSATASDLTLNVNSTGAKPIKCISNSVLSSIANSDDISNDVLYRFYYDGTNWVINDSYTSSILEEQYIYIQAVSGTSSMAANTTWVTATTESVSADTENLTPVWTTKRPTYRSNYPIIFTAKQSRYLDGTVECTTPLIDDTVTVIDGGHISTGSITIGKLASAVQNAITNAATTASNYITEITGGGIIVHPSDDNTTGWKISSSLELLKNSISYIKAWIDDGTSKVRIGPENEVHTSITSSDFYIADGEETKAFEITGVEGHEIAEWRVFESFTSASYDQEIYDTTGLRYHTLYKSILYTSSPAMGTSNGRIYKHPILWYWENHLLEFRIAINGEIISDAPVHYTFTKDNDWSFKVTVNDHYSYLDGYENKFGIEPDTTYDIMYGMDYKYWTSEPIVTIGNQEKSHAQIDYHSLQLIDKEGNAYLHISDLRDASGLVTITETMTLSDRAWTSSIGNEPFTYYRVNFEIYSVESILINNSVSVSSSQYTIFNNNGIVFNDEISQIISADSTMTITYKTNSDKTKAYTFGNRAENSNIGPMSYAEGTDVTASGENSHAEGDSTTASDKCSHAEGFGTTASGRYSHAEGHLATASGFISHADGYGTTASGFISHAEGYGTTASGDTSHAEGYWTTASGKYSHAQNRGTIASGEAQTAIGKYNADYSGNAFMIGDGTSDSDRHSLFAVRWNGELAMGAKDGGSNISLYQNHVTRGTTPSSDAWLSGLQWRDVNGQRLGIVEMGNLADGTSKLDIYISTGGTSATGNQSGIAIVKTHGNTNSRYLIYNGDDGNLSLNGLGKVTGTNAIELTPSSATSNDGGYIDFHYNRSTADYTTRIIEDTSGRLSVYGTTIELANSGSPIVNVRQTTFDLSKTDNSVTNTIYPGFEVIDKSRHISVRLENVVKPNGDNGFQLYARQYDTDGNYTNQRGISYTLTKSGTGTWSVADGNNFRSVIGAQATLTDTYTTTISDILTASSAATIVAAAYRQYGKVAQLYIQWKNNNAITVPPNGNITNITVGTLVSGKRPKMWSAGHSNGDSAGAAWYNFASDGIIGLGACEGYGTANRTIAANTVFYFWATYILP